MAESARVSRAVSGNDIKCFDCVIVATAVGIASVIADGSAAVNVEEFQSLLLSKV